MQKMPGGHALAKTLKEHGVEHVFGIPGSHILSIYDGLIDEPSITPVLARHEQGRILAGESSQVVMIGAVGDQVTRHFLLFHLSQPANKPVKDIRVSL